MLSATDSTLQNQPEQIGTGEPVPPPHGQLFAGHEVAAFEKFIDNLATENEFLFHPKVPASLSWDGFQTTKNQGFDEVKHSGLQFGTDTHFSQDGYIATHRYVPAGYGHVHPHSTAQRAQRSSSSSQSHSRRTSLHGKSNAMNLGSSLQIDAPELLLKSPATDKHPLVDTSNDVRFASKTGQSINRIPGHTKLDPSMLIAAHRDFIQIPADSMQTQGFYPPNDSSVSFLGYSAQPDRWSAAGSETPQFGQDYALPQDDNWSRKRSESLEVKESAKKVKTETGSATGKQPLTAGKLFCRQVNFLPAD